MKMDIDKIATIVSKNFLSQKQFEHVNTDNLPSIPAICIDDVNVLESELELPENKSQMV